MQLNISNIQTLKTRAATEVETVETYAEAWKSRAKFPPVEVFHDGSRYFLADGLHRLLAAKKAGMTTIEATIKDGRKEDALWFAAGSNQTHGLRRSNADKRRAVEIALRLRPQWTDRAIAQHCGVGHPIVGEVRARLQGSGGISSNCPDETLDPLGGIPTPSLPPQRPLAPPPTRIGRDGKHYPALPPRRPGPPPSRPAPPPRPKVLDKIGREIPPELHALWNRSDEVSQQLLVLSRLKKQLKDANDEGDLLYSECNLSGVIAHIEQASGLLKTGIPYTVCPVCQGKLRNDCRACVGRGFISKHRWDRVVPEEQKALILKTVEQP